MDGIEILSDEGERGLQAEWRSAGRADIGKLACAIEQRLGGCLFGR
jgi:hypothetical protein